MGVAVNVGGENTKAVGAGVSLTLVGQAFIHARRAIALLSLVALAAGARRRRRWIRPCRLAAAAKGLWICTSATPA